MASTDNDKRPVTERRDFKLDLAKCEVRSAEGDAPATFSGYAAVFGQLSVNLGGFRERIQAGAFSNAVDEGQDVRFLINHDSNLILGRSIAGTITLTEDEVGLRVECELPNTSYANDLVESMRRGDIDAMSFGFVTRGEEWREKDPETGLPIRELVQADLFDVSVVCYPAYPDTSAEVRTYIAVHTPELLERAVRAAEDLAELNIIETPDADTSEQDRLREQFEEARGLAGVRIQDDHPLCQGVAVVWNFNDELQSCHTEREAAEAQVEAMTSGAAGAAREGKTLSKSNADKLSEAADLLQSVLDAAGEIGAEIVELNESVPDGEQRDTLARPSFTSYREQLELARASATAEERAWTWDDDYAVWILTELIELASCFLLYERDEDDDDSEAATVMKALMTQVTSLLAAQVAESVGENSNDPDGETRDETEAGSRFDRERRRLRVKELELAV